MIRREGGKLINGGADEGTKWRSVGEGAGGELPRVSCLEAASLGENRKKGRKSGKEEGEKRQSSGEKVLVNKTTSAV